MRYVSTIIFSFMLSITIIAQDSCSAYVSDVLATMDSICEDTGRNELCYGNNIVSVETVTGESLDFSQPGDIVPIAEIDSIRTNPFAEPDEWGIALMKIQANIPDSLPGQNVTFLLFGDVHLMNADSETPMKAVYFSSGIGEAGCNEVPQDGILIQTPDVDDAVELVINNVEIQLGSTVYLQAEADHAMWIYVLEGFAAVTADGTTVIVPEGAFVWIPIDEDLHATGEPVEAEGYIVENVEDVPIDALDEDIETAEPITFSLVTQTVVVDGNADWVDTGIEVNTGQQIYFSADGSINVWANCEEELALNPEQEGLECGSLIFDPNGGTPVVDGVLQEFVSDPNFPAPDVMFHSLIGRIGGGEPFLIGSHHARTSDGAGTLQLRLNDVDTNNSGEFVVHILALSE